MKTKKTYSDLLLDPQWQKKRLEIMKRDNFACSICNDTKTTLHIHHKKYLKGKYPWNSPDDDLTTLCSHCHSFVESIKALLNEKRIELCQIKGISFHQSDSDKVLRIYNLGGRLSLICVYESKNSKEFVFFDLSSSESYSASRILSMTHPNEEDIFSFGDKYDDLSDIFGK